LLISASEARVPSTIPPASRVLTELWQAFRSRGDLAGLFAEDAVVQLAFPLVAGGHKHLVGRENIADAMRALDTSVAGDRPRGELRLVMSSSNEAVAEYQRHPSESVSGARRIFVWLLERDGRITHVRVLLERRRRPAPSR